MPISSAAFVMFPLWRRSASVRNSRSKRSTMRSFASRNVGAPSPCPLAGGGGSGVEQVGFGDLRGRREEQRLLERRAELAHVPAPIVGDDRAHRFRAERLRLAAEALRRLFGEMVDEKRHVLAPVGERGNPDLDDAEPVVQVLAELSGRYRRL